MRRKSGKSLKVLFIGNSFTSRNDLPGLIAGLAAAAGHRLEHRLISAGGASLRRHWNGGEAAAAIRDGQYDYVVLQEQSTLPIKSPQRFFENVRLLDQAIKAVGSKTALYMTWARQHAPETQRALIEGYTSAARETGARLIPAGATWADFVRQHDRPVLYDKDGSHPSLAGSYLVACVGFQALFGGALPNDPKVACDLSDDDRRSLQQFTESHVG